MQEQYTACPITRKERQALIIEVIKQLKNEAYNEGRRLSLADACSEAKFLVDDLYVVVEEVK